MIWCHMIFRPTTHLMPYWDIFPFWLRFVDVHWFAWSFLFMRCISSWWSIFILRWFPKGAFLESFSQAHTFWYFHDSLMELCQAHRLTYHHFSGIHVRSLYIPIELFSSHQDGPDILVDILGHIFFGYPHGRMRQFLYWGIFPLFYCGDDCFLTELLPFSLFRWGIFIHINGHDINDLCRDELDLWVLTVSLPMTL